MSHVAFVPLVGFRIKEEEMAAWGMSLPGFQSRAAAIAELPALGLLTLGGLTPESWTCSYHPTAICDEGVIQQIVSSNPTLVAVSALTASVDEAYHLCDKLRELGISTVMGGLHVTASVDEALNHCDSVVVGSAERVWPDVLHDSAQQQLQSRYLAGHSDVEWAAPRLDLMNRLPSRFTLQTQRGCPLACEFCGASRLLGGYREKPLQLIRDELQAIKRLAHRPFVELADDNTFVGGTARREQLLDLFEQEDVRWFTESDWRIGEDPQLLQQLAQSGCRQILVGIESLVFRYPGQGNKQSQLDRIMAAIDAIQDAGVVVNGCFIVGADGETSKSMDRLGDFIVDSDLGDVQLTVQTPFPGTGLRRRLHQQGRLLPARGNPFYTLFDVVYQPDQMTVEELELRFRELLARVYSAGEAERRSRIRHRIWRSRR